MFADAPYLLKLLRNWLIETRFILEGGKEITKDALKSLTEIADTEISSCHKLSMKHIEPKGKM